MWGKIFDAVAIIRCKCVALNALLGRREHELMNGEWMNEPSIQLLRLQERK